jgi:hypothetical protein
LTNQVPATDAGDVVDVHFDVPAIRAYGPDHLDSDDHVS